LDDLDARVEDSIADGSNFDEAVAVGKLAVTTTPLITAAGTSRTDANFRLPAELAPALKAGFDMQPNDPPDVIALPNDQGYVMVSPAQVVPAAPAPLATIRDRVAGDWLNEQAFQRAKATAAAIAAKAARGIPLAEAIKGSAVPLPPVRPLAARRIQIAMAGGQVPVPLKMLFTLSQGKAQAQLDPQGRGFYVVKVGKIVPGNALLQPGLITKMQQDLGQGMQEELAAQFVAAVRADMKAKRNESAIQAEKSRITSSGG
jgi:peptidyl-prolyl cis-trans isomerase D